jgi:hypothetical protein
MSAAKEAEKLASVTAQEQPKAVEAVLGSRTGQMVVREVVRRIFATLERG